MNKTFLISVPSDGKGFIGRACASPRCQQYFKVETSRLKDFLNCPYCGELMSKESLLTREQLNHVHRAVAEEVKIYAITEMQKMFERTFSGSKYITYKPGPLPIRQSIVPRYKERDVDTELQCSECETQFQVYGIFGFCPGCKCENLQIYDANWAIIKRDIASAEDKMRQLRHAYGDLISTFEIFCARKAKKLTPERGKFQILFDARKFFNEHANVDMLAPVSASGLLSLRRAFQKRHVYIHAGGIITEQYIRMIPEDKTLLGTQAELSELELDEAASAMRIALGALVRAIERPGK